jgi:hypothetical protein
MGQSEPSDNDLQQSRAKNCATGNDQSEDDGRLVHWGQSRSGVLAARGARGGWDRRDASTAGGSSAGGNAAGVLGAGSGETGTLSSATLHHLRRAGGDCREGVAGHVPGRALGGAAALSTSGVVSSSSWGRGGGLESSLESGEVRSFGDSVALDGDQAVFVSFLGVLVDETARVNGGHLGVVQSSNLFKLAGVGVATVLGQAVIRVSLRDGDLG